MTGPGAGRPLKPQGSVGRPEAWPATSSPQDQGSVGEGLTASLRREHLFSPKAFTSLKVNQAIVKAFDGVKVLDPWVVYLKPMHEDPEVSWFETTGREVGELGREVRRG